MTLLLKSLLLGSVDQLLADQLPADQLPADQLLTNQALTKRGCRVLSLRRGLIAGILWAGVSAIAPTPSLAETLPSTAESISAKPVSPEVQPDPKLDELSFFVQDWQCETKTHHASNDSSVQPILSNWSVLRELKGFWFLGLRTDVNREPIQHDTLGYNTIFQKFGWTILGNDGRFGNVLSEGWDGDRMTWEGSLVDLAARTRVKYRVMMTKTGDRAFQSRDYVLQEGQENWTPVSNQSCTSQSSQP